MNGNEPICPCNVTTPDSERVRVYKTEWFNGLTKREWFAGMALSGLLANPIVLEEAARYIVSGNWERDGNGDVPYTETCARNACSYADALLAALGKEGE